MVIYEAHVKGLTMLNEHVKKEHRGKFLGVSDPWMVQHLKKLGVTHVQLMPIFKSEGTCWGYDPVSWFEVDPRYGTLEEFIQTTTTLGEAGIGVILDVVYNHTKYPMEGVSYYPWDVSGCGNTVDVRASLDVIERSMDYWFNLGIAGMRFDLANILGREGGNFNPNAEFFKRCEKYINAGKIMIAEPWDCAEYSLGRFPSGWLEFNDRFRDRVRQGHVYRYSDLPDNRSIAFITCHDGFTLHDLVSYNRKHNRVNGEDNRDGTNNNNSYNFGHEGPTLDRDINAKRELHKDWLISQMMNSGHAAKFILAGDECNNSQIGVNNAYSIFCDNEIGWVVWGPINYGRFTCCKSV